jgi:hypothetical protein
MTHTNHADFYDCQVVPKKKETRIYQNITFKKSEGSHVRFWALFKY